MYKEVLKNTKKSSKNTKQVYKKKYMKTENPLRKVSVKKQKFAYTRFRLAMCIHTQMGS